MKTTTSARQLAQIWHKVKCKGIPFSKDSFKKVGGATGARLYDVLIQTRYYDPIIHEYVSTFIQDSNKKCMKPNIPANWGVDEYSRFIENFVLGKAEELGIEIIQKRGRKTGISPFKKEIPVEEVVETSCEEVEIQQEDVEPDPYLGITLLEAIKLVKEVAKRESLTVKIIIEWKY